MKDNPIILCPIHQNKVGSKNPLLFGVNYMEGVAKERWARDVTVKVLVYDQSKWTKAELAWLNVKMAWRILTTRHDILYYGIDPNILFLLAMLKAVGLYRKPMYCWKYMELTRSKNAFVRFIKRQFYGAFDCVFMLTERHVALSVADGMVDARRCQYVKWGNDLDYIDSIKPSPRPQTDQLAFVSVGKALRDFDTLCQAFKGVDARLKIFTVKRWNALCRYQETLSKYDLPNVETHYVEDLALDGSQTIAERLYAELKAADVSMVICQKVNFGCGYTSVIDSLACGTAIIATAHPDNPIDIDRESIGLTVPAADVAALRKVLLRLTAHPDEVVGFKRKARAMAEGDYNIREVCRKALDVMFEDR